MLHILLWLYTHVLSICFKCFICFQTYVSSVLSRCLKSRYGEGHVAMEPVAGGQRPTMAACWGAVMGHCAGAYGGQCAYAGGAGDWDRSHSYADT
jgi:hypothetical protein